MIKSRIAVAGALLAIAGAAHAEFTVTPTVTSDYDFRGFTQTDKDPAFQLGATYTHESGFYAGAWTSNVEFADADVEIDAFAGFAGGDAAKSFGYDVGAILYAYPSASGADSVIELYAGLSKGWVSGKLWFSPDNYNHTSWYAEGNVAFPLSQGFSIPVHAGYSFGNYWKNGAAGEYFDYSIGVAKNLGNFALSLKYVNSNDYKDPVAGRNAVIGTISTTLPWKAD